MSYIVRFTCAALYNILAEIYLPQPSSPEEWQEVANGFYDLWNFPHCIGALDGKHVRIKQPNNSGSSHWNYKQFNSIVFLGMCDAKYKFTYADIGAPGRLGDSSVFHSSSLKKDLEEGTLGLPSPEQLPRSAAQSPYVIVGDEAFPLTINIMRPYLGRSRPGHLSELERIFNYR